MTLPAVGASVCASGSQVCSGTTGSLTAKPASSRKNIPAAGSAVCTSARPCCERSMMSSVPVVKYRLRMPASIRALPKSV